MPVKMSKPPSTPKAGSSLVSNLLGSGVADADAEVLADADAEADELVGVAVTVTLKMVVRRLVAGTKVSPERVDETNVAVLVVSERDVDSV